MPEVGEAFFIEHQLYTIFSTTYFPECAAALNMKRNSTEKGFPRTDLKEETYFCNTNKHISLIPFELFF